MKIIKGADRGRTEWTTRKLVEFVEDGTVNFNIDIQRGYVWKDNDKKSALIRSLILDRHVPPLYFNKVEDIYEGEDGKQRTLTIVKFLKDEFELSGLEEFTVINDEGETEEVNINGYKFSDLPECFQNAIKEYSFTICYTDNADQEEQADTFYNLNNGQVLNAATMNRVKAKSKKQIISLGKHKLFEDALSQTAMDGHVNEDRTTAGIMRINQELDKISGLGGIASDKIEELEKQIKTMVFDILENHSEASMFDYYGDGSNMLSSSAKYDASLRIKEIEKAIRNVQKDGLRVALNDGKLCVENTVRTMNTNDYTEPFGYSEINCFAD